MSNTRTALLVSVGVNIFLVAFTLGRLSTPGMMPPPPFMDDGGMGPRDHGQMPPPFFGPSELLSPEEMREHEAQVRPYFKKLDGLRKAFATQLLKGPVSKEDVLKHFEEMDAIMGKVITSTHTKAAEKISAMNTEERTELAKHLQKQCKPHHDGPPHD